jgi:hypothetical protein
MYHLILGMRLGYKRRDDMGRHGNLSLTFGFGCNHYLNPNLKIGSTKSCCVLPYLDQDTRKGWE